MKKRLCISVIVFVLWCVTASCVYASEETACMVSADKGEVKAGDTLTLAVNILNANELAKLQLTLNYDAEKLEYKSKTYGAVLNGITTAKSIVTKTEGKVGFAATIKDNALLSGDGVLFMVSFTVKDSASAGTIDYSITGIKFGKADGDAVQHDEYFDREHSSEVRILPEEIITSAEIRDSILSIQLADRASDAVVAAALYDDLKMTYCFLVENCSDDMLKINISEFDGKYTRVKVFALENTITLRPLGSVRAWEYNE